MRTTIDLDDSLLHRLREEAHDQGIPFRTLLHRVIQRGLDADRVVRDAPYSIPPVSLGQLHEGIDLLKATALASALDDAEVVRKMAERR